MEDDDDVAQGAGDSGAVRPERGLVPVGILLGELHSGHGTELIKVNLSVSSRILSMLR